MTTKGYVGCTQWEKNQKLREFKKKIIKWLKLNLKDVYRSLEPTMGGNISIPFYGLFFRDNGIGHQSSCVDTSQQNGIAE